MKRTPQELYNKKYFILSKKFQFRKTRIDEFTQVVMRHSPAKVLDVGCGLGSLVYSLRKLGVDARGLDFATTLRDDFGHKEEFFVFADAKKMPFPDNSFDVVFSSDFFEHLDEEDVPVVLNEMKRVGGKVIAYVAPEADLNERQLEFHRTNKPMSWWRDNLPGVEILQSERTYEQR